MGLLNKQALPYRYYTSMLACSSSYLWKVLLLLLLALYLECGAGDLNSDKAALLGFFNGLQGAPRLLNWSNSTSPCSWVGVQCTAEQDNVIALKLPGTGLYGTIRTGTLGTLSHLQILSLRLNHLSGPLPQDLLKCTQLKKLFLQSNFFSGSILPFNATSNPQLSVVDASFNGFSGMIPRSFADLPHLKILLLQNNSLSGSIPPSIGALSQFNVTNNNLSGSIPPALRSFPNSSFSGNVGLCGPPLSLPCPNPVIAPSSPSTFPFPPAPLASPVTKSPGHKSKKQLSTSAIVLIVIADVAFLFLLSALCMLWHSKKRASTPAGSTDKVEKGAKERGFAKAVGEGEDAKEDYSSAQEPEHNKLVFFHGGQLSFDLEDLLRASAEVLGKGTFGTSYKAVLEDGPTVVVKRLKEASVGRKEFEQHMDGAGKMRHRNLVPMRAYYYSKEEKLLVHEYLPLGSVAAAIHGRKSSGEPALDWQSRLKIAVGAARGLEYLHGTSSKCVHGDIKPSNILLHREFQACISDYGLAPLFWTAANNATAIASRMAAGYRAPEVAKTRKLTQKSDVYSFGVVLLELLTGKAPSQTSAEQGMDLPKWVQSVVREEWTSEVFDHELMKFSDIEEEMVQLLQIALTCVSSSPDQRPTMAEVLKMVQDVRHLSDPSAADEEGRSPTTTTHSSTPQERSARDSPAATYASIPAPAAKPEVESPTASPTASKAVGSPSLITASSTTREAKLESSSPTNTASEANIGSVTPITTTGEGFTSPTTDMSKAATSSITPTTITSTTNTDSAAASPPKH